MSPIIRGGFVIRLTLLLPIACVCTPPFAEIIYTELTSFVPHREYIPSTSGFYVQREPKPGSEDTIVRAVLGITVSSSTMDTANACSNMSNWMTIFITDFFTEVQNITVIASPFNTMACKLEDRAPAELSAYTKTTVLLGFIRPQVLNVPGETTTPSTIKLNGQFYKKDVQNSVTQLSKLLEASFGPLSTSLTPSDPIDQLPGENGESDLKPLRFRNSFRAKAVLNETWTDELNNPNDALANAIAVAFCVDVHVSLQIAYDNKHLQMSCEEHHFIPLNFTDPQTQMIVQKTIISVQFILEGADFIKGNSTVVSSLINLGYGNITIPHAPRVIGTIQVVRLDEFFTCTKDANLCSSHAKCIQLPDGIACACGPLFTDTFEEQPGTYCAYNATLITLIVVLSGGSMIALLMAILFITQEDHSYQLLF